MEINATLISPTAENDMAFLVEVSTFQGAWLLSMLRDGDIEMTGPAEVCRVRRNFNEIHACMSVRTLVLNPVTF